MGCFYECLSPVVREWLHEYIRRWPGCVYNLNQNPFGFAVRSTTTTLNTVIKNAGQMWSHIHKRWLTPSELLVAQGFPVRSSFTHGRPCCSFAVERPPHMPPRKRSAIIGQAGNSMNCNIAGIMLLFCFLEVPRAG